MSIYLPNTTNGSAFKFNDGGGNVPPSTLAGDNSTEYTSGERNTVSTNDSNFVSTGGIASGHRVLSTITETPANVDSLKYTMAWTHDGQGGGGDVELFIWNFNTEAWVATGQKTTGSVNDKTTRTFTESANPQNFINGSGQVYFMCQNNHPTSNNSIELYYAELDVTASATPPSVTTNEATGVTDTTATLNGTLDISEEETVDVFFRYRVKDTGSFIDTASQTLTASGTFDQALTELEPSTLYEFKTVVEWGAEEDEGGLLEFTTDEAVVSSAVSRERRALSIKNLKRL